jgi:hypothetical protein
MSFSTYFDMYTPYRRILRHADYGKGSRLVWNNGLMWDMLVPKPDVVGNITEDVRVLSVFELVPSKLWHSRYRVESAGIRQSVFLNEKRV